MKENIQDSLIQIIKDSLRNLGLDKSVQESVSLDVPANIRFGDLSANIALRLSALAKKPSLEIATSIVNDIKRYLEKSPLKDYVKEIKIEGAGFINFYLDDRYFYGYLQDIIRSGRGFLSVDFGEKRRVLIEFVSANPTGPLSVAHARQAAVGDALANILAFTGFKVKREYYLNDEGNQINILGRSVGLRIKELSGEKIEFPEDHYQGEYIYDIARKVQSQKRKPQDLSAYAVKYILDAIRKELDDFGVRFDYWYSQKGLRESGKIKKVLAFLKKKGFLYEQDGALWLKSTHFGDDKDRVVVKSDGTYTYLAPDIAYHQDKFKRRFTMLINLWGPDHHGYINRLKAAIKALGKDAGSLSIIIVQLASIFREGKPVQMSTRRGQYITLREVLDEIGKDASRFFFLMRRTSSHLEFDLETAKKQTPENPVYYVQYAHARICSILRNAEAEITKSGASQRARPKDIDFSILKEQEEIRLIKKLWQFSYILNACANALEPYMLIVYLQELAECFHKFYDVHRVLGQDDKLTRARLAFLQATKIVIASALELIGVSKPEKM